MKREWLLYKRLEKGLTQQEVADKAGIHLNTYMSAENNKRKPRMLARYNIAKVLGFPVELWEEK